MGKKYKNPPIVEALCVFQFSSEDLSFDFLKLNSIYERVKKDFPKYEKIQLPVIHSEGEIQSAEGIQFLKKDKKAIIQLAPNLLVINILKPYSTWEDFFDLLKNTLTIYHEVFNYEEVLKITLRYLNKIDLKGKSIQINDYFDFTPSLGKNSSQKNLMFDLKVFVPYEKKGEVLKIELNKISTKAQSYLLDLDYSFAKKDMSITKIEEILSWLNKAHTHIEEAFENSITQKSRDMFNEEVDK